MTRDTYTKVLWWLLPFAVLVVSTLIQTTGGVYFHMFTHDMFIPLEGVLHLHNGHLPHRDFVTPIGALYYFVHYLPSLIVPISAKTLIYANLLVATVVALATLVFGRQRLPLWLASLVALYLGIIASSPRQIGEPFTLISNNASYNRFGWALIGLLALVAACPRLVPTRRSSLIDGAVVGSLLTGLFLIKLTYAGAALGIVLLTMVTTRKFSDWRYPLMLFGLFASVALAIELSTGLIHLYLSDVQMTASVTTNLLRPDFAVRLLFYCATGAVAVLMVGLINEWDQRRFHVWVPRTLLSLAIVMAGVVIGIQNHPELENPLLAVAVLIAGYPSLRFLNSRAAQDAPATKTTFDNGAANGIAKLLAGRACIIGFVAMAAGPVAQDVAAIAWVAVAPRASGSEVAWLAETPLSDLTLFATEPTKRGTAVPGTSVRDDVDLIGVIGDGVALIRPHVRGRDDAVVLPLTFSNPYPVLLGLLPVRHELAWWHADRTFSRSIKPNADLLLSGVDFVMLPKRYTNYSNVAAFRDAYAPEIARDFRVADENATWLLFARNRCQMRLRC